MCQRWNIFQVYLLLAWFLNSFCQKILSNPKRWSFFCWPTFCNVYTLPKRHLNNFHFIQCSSQYAFYLCSFASPPIFCLLVLYNWRILKCFSFTKEHALSKFLSKVHIITSTWNTFHINQRRCFLTTLSVSV